MVVGTLAQALLFHSQISLADLSPLLGLHMQTLLRGTVVD